MPRTAHPLVSHVFVGAIQSASFTAPKRQLVRHIQLVINQNESVEAVARTDTKQYEQANTHEHTRTRTHMSAMENQ